MFVPRREKNRKAFTSPDGLSLLAKVTGWERDGDDKNVSVIAYRPNSTAIQRPFKPGHGNLREVTPLYDQEKDK